MIISGKAADRPQNQKAIVALWKEQQAAAPGDLIYLGSRSYSAEFYSAGWARHSKNLQQLPKTANFYLVQRQDTPQPLPTACRAVGQANGSQLHYCAVSL